MDSGRPAGNLSPTPGVMRGIKRMQREKEGGAPVRHALGPDLPAMAVDDARHGGETDAGAGEFGRRMQALESAEESRRVGHVEAGWAFAPAAWGKGYATEAMRAVLTWADETLSLSEIRAIIDSSNAASMGVATKLGFGQIRETLPEMPDELKQQLRDYVPNDLKARRAKKRDRLMRYPLPMLQRTS